MARGLGRAPAEHIGELRKRAHETDAKLKRLYEAIESGAIDTSDPTLEGRVAELTGVRDQARADADRAEAAIDRLGPSITCDALRGFALEARRRLRTEDGRYRRNYLRALAQRVEAGVGEVRIMGSKTELLRTLVAASGVGGATIGVRSLEPKWRPIVDETENYSYSVVL